MTCGFRNCQSRACGSTVRPDGHELAYCVAHEAIARHLPTLRSARCCTSEGCGRPQGSRSPLCKSCRPRYSAWGLDGYPVPQEAPMPTTPEAQTPPPAAPQEAADGGATPSPAVDAVEPSEGDVADAPLFVGGTDSAPVLPGRWGQKHTAPLDGLAALAARGQQPPTPTLAEVQAELARERERADRAELDAVQERARADEAMEELRNMRSDTRAELHAVCLLMQRLGSYGPDAPAMLLRLLPVESRRALLEIEAADARGELARARANVVDPPPPGRLEECAAKVADVEAKLAALDR